jgi:hypothetical protein
MDRIESKRESSRTGKFAAGCQAEEASRRPAGSEECYVGIKYWGEPLR